MIHSMSGGVLSDNKKLDFAKVQFATGEIFWYITNISDLQIGDNVIVPVGKTNKPTKATVLRIDYAVSIQSSPVPYKIAKEIICKI